MTTEEQIAEFNKAGDAKKKLLFKTLLERFEIEHFHRVEADLALAKIQGACMSQNLSRFAYTTARREGKK